MAAKKTVKKKTTKKKIVKKKTVTKKTVKKKPVKKTLRLKSPGAIKKAKAKKVSKIKKPVIKKKPETIRRFPEVKMIPYDKIINRLQSMQIKGSENIALYSIHAIKDNIYHSKAKNKKQLMEQMKKAKTELEHTIKTEPCMRNSLSYLFYKLRKKSVLELTHEICERADSLLAYYNIVENKIGHQGQKLIQNGMTIFVHSYSTSVLKVLEHAKREKKRFKVNVTETRPYYHGRKMAKEIAKMGIPVKMHTDMAARIAMKESDLCLLGCDAITPRKVVYTVGSELVSLLAKNYNKPVYMCTNSWKFDVKHIGLYGKLEEKPGSDVWHIPKTNNLTIKNYLFEMIHPELIKGIVSEMGVHKHKEFVKEIRKRYPWFFHKSSIYFF